ncbi:hypothetical protein J1N35_007168 [Gossypium stocksii]|uniref:SWIM-type domain-containing protein n=1 Tax=Gossypium stocksii TaxID=47602 RepID=A0A9D4AFB8_9ROSI|nr:hypothetical protein J1N35_007168 [Gossypium stocksii]
MEPEDVEGGSNDEEENLRFRAYSPPAHMHNVDLSIVDTLEFSDLPYRRHDHISSSLDLGELEVSVLQDYPKMDSNMLASLILPTVKVDPETLMLVFIANIHSQLRYTPSYRKAWIAKQKALENMHTRWDASYNELWQWCQVLERYVPGCITNLEMALRTTTTDCSVDAKCSSNFFGALSNTEMHLVTASLWYKLTLTKKEKTNSITYLSNSGHKHMTAAYDMVTEFDRLNQGITSRQYRVHLRNRTCDYKTFDMLRYPCAHVIEACQNLCLDPMRYFDKVCKLETMYNVRRHVFPPIPDERKWPPVLLAPFKLLPDRELRHKPKG